MQFADVLGQASIKDVLFRFGQSQRIPHALLFLGPEGSGTLPMALAFAQQLLCEVARSQRWVRRMLSLSKSCQMDPPGSPLLLSYSRCQN
jgi:DNA polymerase III gamma/tau subunit